jgi:cytochrome P450
MQTDFDILSPDFNDRYDDVLNELIDGCPVARSNTGRGYWVVSQYRDVTAALSDVTTFPSGDGVLVNRPSFEELGPLLPAEMDPPNHTVWRRALAPHFTANRLRNLSPAIERLCHDLIDAFIEEGRCDFAQQFSKSLPGLIFFSLIIGTPTKDLPYLRQAVDEYLVDYGETQAEAYARVTDYIRGYLSTRSAEPPRNDVVDAILALERYPDGEEIPLEDKVRVTSLLLAGGLETSANAISAAIFHMATHPEDQRRIRDNLDLVSTAVEEILRVYAPTFGVSRKAAADTEIAGQAIAKGDMVMFAIAAANRDPHKFDEPLTVDIARGSNRHLSFGHDLHRCIGAHLARLEIEMAIRTVSQRLDAIELAGPPIMRTSMVRVFEHLNITFRLRTP